MTGPDAFVAAALFLVGLCVGSFLNVVIARLPAGRSIVSPRSACPHCAAPIAWYDNLPILSFLALGARCRRCRAPIAWRYPIVELVTGCLFVLALLTRGFTRELPVALVLVSALVAITGIDLDHQIIPDVITLPGIAFGLVASFFTGRPSWQDALIGGLAGGAVFFVIIVVSGGGMGGGDMKLGAMLGSFLGWKPLMVAILAAVLAGGVVAIALLALGRKGRKDAVPFGPFLALGGLIALFWGERLMDWYLGAFVGGPPGG
jgi:leader peptidase (prepilin peptidase) / N-methyltransferase